MILMLNHFFITRIFMDNWHRLASRRRLCFIIIVITLVTMKDGVSSANDGDADAPKKKIIPDFVCNGTWCASEFKQNFEKLRFSTIGIVAGGYVGDALESKAKLTFFVRKKNDVTGTYVLEAKAIVESMNHTTLTGKTVLNAFGVVSEDVYPVLPEPVGDGYKPYCAPLAPVPGINICMNLYYFKCDPNLEGRACFKIEFVVYNKIISKIQFDCVNFERGNITVSAPDGGPAASNPDEKKKWYEFFKKSSYASTARK
ncbi:hypothetical protein LSTR_LSTR000774 [Laodelphax striatellus]|uniref:DUF4773 domain-containing protein n=1 Tax=Laodelphax striatellus TaxID=195883 RepID=A0A482XGG1_LAOST|nr:hypothetical protein LSTR_LSTR000774 [Laodelphax striatellus]